jgi:CRP/FNR family transcriptional regulator
MHDLRAVSDGDDRRFCGACAFSQVCLSAGFDKRALHDLHVLVEHAGPFAPGSYLFRERDPFNAIAAVRAGTVKTSVFDSQGHEQVLGFYLPGEIIGLSAIHSERYPCNAIAIDRVELCRFSFPKMALLATRMPGLQRELFRLLSADIGKAGQLTGDFSADERVASFLVSLARRSTPAERPASRLRLPMPRLDIASYLRLTPETVSRVLRRFRQDDVIRVEGRELAILNAAALAQLAGDALRD